MRRRFRIEHAPAPGERVILDARASHHLLHVLRVPRGDDLLLFDGSGGQWEAVLADVVAGLAHAEVKTIATPPEAEPTRELVLALTRKPAWELALRMATELGVTAVLPFVARRSVVTEAHQDRWQRILESAAQQCGRSDLPRVLPCQPLVQQLGLCKAGNRLLLSPGAATLPTPDFGGVALVIGPEGGLTEDEQSTAINAEFQPTGLGRWTLRADTAVVAALARYGLPTPRSTR